MRGLETERRSKRMSEHTNIPRSLSAVSLPTRPPRRDRPKDALPALYFEMLHTHTQQSLTARYRLMQQRKLKTGLLKAGLSKQKHHQMR